MGIPSPSVLHLYCNKIYIINCNEVTGNCLGIAVVFNFSVNKSHWLDNLEHVSLPVVIAYMWDCGSLWWAASFILLNMINWTNALTRME